MTPCIHMPTLNAIVTVGGPIIRMETNHGVVGFEWHDYFGPMPVKLTRGCVGDERKLRDKHDFWNKVTEWAKNGRVVRNGWAVVRP